MEMRRPSWSFCATNYAMGGDDELMLGEKKTTVGTNNDAPFTQYNRLSNRLYSRFDNRIDNRLYLVYSRKALVRLCGEDFGARQRLMAALNSVLCG